MIIRYSTTKENLKKWISEKQDENPVKMTDLKYEEVQPDLTQAALFLQAVNKDDTNNNQQERNVVS